MPAYMKLGDIKGEVSDAHAATRMGSTVVAQAPEGPAVASSLNDYALITDFSVTHGAKPASAFSNGANHAEGGYGNDVLIGGTTTFPPYDHGFNGGVVVAAGNAPAGDDVVVDGLIITAEDWASAQHELGHLVGFHHGTGAKAVGPAFSFAEIKGVDGMSAAGGANTCFGDGSVRFLSAGIDTF